MEEKKLTLGSLFDGIGGFPFAGVLSGVIPIWASEIEPFCIAVAKYHFPQMQHLGNIMDIDGGKIPPVDIITFGSPCQDMSVAGQRAGLKHTENGDDETTRSGLFVEAIRIIYEMRIATNGKYPKYIVWENVPGAFSSNKGHDFKTVLEEITKTDIPMPSSGKWSNAGVVRSSTVTAAWRLLDAKYWGVPQRRKRIYLVGSFGSNAAEEILFKCDSVQRYIKSCGAEGENTSEDIRNSIESSNKIFDARGNGDGSTVPTITGDHCSRVNDYAPVLVYSAGFLDRAPAEAGSIGYEKEVSPTLRAGLIPSTIYAAGFNGQNSVTAAGADFEEEHTPPIIRNKQTNVFCLQGNMIGRADKNGPQGCGINEDISFTINTTDRHAVVYNNSCFGGYTEGVGTLKASGGDYGGGSKNIVAEKLKSFRRWIVRRLTPLECERLQGFPNYWTCLPTIDNMNDEEFRFWQNVIKLHKEINGKKPTIPCTAASMVKWYNKLDNDGNRYKALGNSLAIPCALRVVGYIADFERNLT